MTALEEAELEISFLHGELEAVKEELSQAVLALMEKHVDKIKRKRYK